MMSSSLKVFQLALTVIIVSITITFGNKISIAPSIPEITHFVNDSHIVFCKSTLRTNWKAPNGFTVGSTDQRIHVEDKGAQLALVFEKISLNDRGKWTCETDGGEYKESFVLIVNRRISFPEEDKLQSAPEGMDTILKCRPVGDPIPIISAWQRNGKEIKFPHPKYLQVSNGILIKNITKDDGGEYICRAFQVSETVSDIQQLNIQLKVQYPPVWSMNNSPKNLYSFIGGDANITCEVDSEPRSLISWFHNSKRLLPVKEKFYSIYDESGKSTIQINVNDKQHFGEYVCKANNSRGSIDRSIILSEGRKPNSPSLCKVAEYFPNKFILEVQPRKARRTNQMDIYRFKVEWFPAKNLDSVNWLTANEKYFYLQSDDDFVLDGLSNNTNYFIRCASQNIAGLSEWIYLQANTRIVISTATKLTISNSILVTLISFKIFY